MRITQSLLLQSHARQISADYERMFRIQEQLSSGRRLLRPSDDPASIRPALDVRSSLRRLDQVRSNADLASADLATADGVLQNASDLISRAREIAMAGANGTTNQSDRDGMAAEVDGLLQQMVALANSRGVSGYLFAGSLKDAPPYSQVETKDGSVVQYHGDQHTTTVDVGDGLQLAVNVPGSEIFAAGTRGKTVYQGITGAAAGTGSDRLGGTDHLTVAHVQTVLGDGAVAGTGDSASGLQIGASSASGDTVLGLSGAHTLTLVDTSGTGSGGTITLDDGTAVDWTSADTDLAVTAGDGTVVHVDLSGVAAGFNGAVAVAGAGTLSLDGGTTTKAIDFTQQNQVVVDAETGSTLFVDARGIRKAGADLVQQPGSSDLLNSLVELREALKNGDGLPDAQRVQRLNASLAALTQGADQVLAALARVGARQKLADTTKARADDMNQLLTSRQANLEDVDFASASIQFSQAQLALQAGIQVSAKVMQMPTLVNLL